MKKQYILALDQGTTSSRAVLFDRDLKAVAAAGREFEQHYPQAGWVEHEPDDLLSSVLESIGEVMRQARVSPAEILAVGITNQRETTVVWSRKTGRPVCRAIVWQCRRTADFCRKLKAEGLEPYVRKSTGLILDPYFSATKLRWILDHVRGVRRRAEAGELLFGTVDTYLAWQLSGGKSHLTDYTNAARTMLFNLHTLDWDDRLLTTLKIPRAMLPEVRPSAAINALCRHPALDFLPIPIGGIAGDQQAALYGQYCEKPGEMKITYGTGAFLLVNTGREFVRSCHGLLTTLTAGARPGRPEYALEGSVFMAGAIMQWLRDGLGILPDTSKTGEIAASVPDSGGVILVPAFTGLGAPHWDAAARAAIFGMTRGTTAAEIIRAADESIAFQCADLAEAMAKDTKKPLQAVRVDGGAARDAFLLQIQADLLQAAVRRPAYLESTVLGAARLALASQGLAEGGRADRGEAVFKPMLPERERRARLKRWRQAVAKVKTAK